MVPAYVLTPPSARSAVFHLSVDLPSSRGSAVSLITSRDLLDNTSRIDSTDVYADPRDSEASWNYDPTVGSDDSNADQSDESDQDTSDDNGDENDQEGDGGYYFGYGCLVVTTGPKLPVAAAFSEQKQVDQETARRVTQDALAVGNPNWMLGDSAFDMLNWHDDLIEESVVPIAPYNERNTNDPYDIEYRIEHRIKEHSDNVGVLSKQLEETYEQRSQVERTIGACKDCGLETPGVRGRVRVKSHVFPALCLRLVIAIANYERGSYPGKTTIGVCQ